MSDRVLLVQTRLFPEQKQLKLFRENMKHFVDISDKHDSDKTRNIYIYRIVRNLTLCRIHTFSICMCIIN